MIYTFELVDVVLLVDFATEDLASFVLLHLQLVRRRRQGVSGETLTKVFCFRLLPPRSAERKVVVLVLQGRLGRGHLVRLKTYLLVGGS